MTQHLTVITGASRGLGLALTEQLLAQGHRVLALARKPTVAAVPTGSELISWEVDLVDSAPVAERLADWLAAQDPQAIASVTLINNAGVVSDPAPLSAGRSADLARALRVGLEAPMLLSAAFLRATATWAAPRKLLMISSGLGRNAMAGSASYCAAKAGMDNLAAPSRWKKPPCRMTRTARASSRWRRASSTPTCRCSCAAPAPNVFPSANASSA